MNKVKLTTIAGLLMFQALPAYGLSQEEDAIVERIKPVGIVCVEGRSCSESSMPETATTGMDDNNARDVVANAVVDNYNKSCATCHTAGLAGAPKFGVSDDWASRVAKGKEALYESSINGLPPAMPAKGMCFSCTDDDLKALVDYMVENSQ